MSYNINDNTLNKLLARMQANTPGMIPIVDFAYRIQASIEISIIEYALYVMDASGTITLTLPTSIIRGTEVTFVNPTKGTFVINGNGIKIIKSGVEYDTISLTEYQAIKLRYLDIGQDHPSMWYESVTIPTGVGGYVHPSTHPAAMIEEDVSHRFVTDTQASAFHAPGSDNQDLSGYVLTDDARLSDPRTPLTHSHPYEPANANIQTHVNSTHAPANAQANADITKAEIEAKLTGPIVSHSHAGGADGEVSVVLGVDRATTSASYVDITGLSFEALPNSTYIIEAFLVFQSNNVTYGIGYGINGPASPSFCVGHVDLMLAASTRYVNNITGYNLVNGTSGSVPVINTNYPGYVWVLLRTGANGGAVTLRHRSENAAGTVTTKAGSTLRYRLVQST